MLVQNGTMTLLFVDTIKHLVNRGVDKVYVNYGILSHPAILLREAGVHKGQSYALYDKRVISRAIEFFALQEYIVAPIELNTPAGDKTEEKLTPNE